MKKRESVSGNRRTVSSRDLLQSQYIKADRLLGGVVWLLFLVSCVFARDYDTWQGVYTVGAPTAIITSALVLWLPGTLVTRLGVATSLMTFAALHIHQEHGVTELHFGVFVFMSFLLAYRDWKPIVCAALVIAIHHLLFSYLQLGGFAVYCLTRPSYSLVLVHAAYVVVQAALLIFISRYMSKEARMGRELAILSAELSRETGRFDLRLTSMPLEGSSSREFKATLDAIHHAMRQITRTIQRIALSSQEIAAGNGELVQQIATQADMLKDTTRAMAQIADQVQENAADALNANGLTQQTADVVRQSGSAVGELVKKMIEIEDASRRMGEMTSTIEGIAFQTNILALNASVEAARAGTHGRGFAVVAEEVRKLAQRSADAAREIKMLITESLERIEHGSLVASRTGAAMRSVVGQVEEVARLVSQISTTSDAQSQDIGRISIAIKEMDAMLTRDVAYVEDVASASGHLRKQTLALNDEVSLFVVDPLV
ncbi:methyl-accepting chemotaxis protein [Paraburkholderia diazotrophica]|uniref:methyl-accepting chemotaxis protein n=1 Tax=Paraburkholderia diazotrophica TaxID=667676 RepID=UPI003178C55F